MDARHRQRVIRAIVIMGIGIFGGMIISFDPLRAMRTVPFLLMSAGMSAWTIAENVALQQDEPRSYHGRLTTRLLQAGVMGTVFVGVIDLFHLQLLDAPAWLPWFGLAVIGTGAWIRVAAIRTLADHFRYELRVEKGQGLVRTGLYARIRHPSYLGLLLLAIGAGLTLGSSPAAIVGILVITPIILARIKDEERVLAEAFGPAYAAYRRESWRLVPFLY